MSAPVPEEKPDGLGEMLEQDVWYQDSSGNWWQVAAMMGFLRAAAADRLMRLALPFARSVYKDLYAYGYPSGEQAQWDLERGEAEAEHIMASAENARAWMTNTTLYRTLAGLRDDEGVGGLEEGLQASPMRKDEQGRVELAELDKVIAATRETLTYLEELRGRLA